MRNNLLEIACFNLESALIAQNAGADRIELCVNYLAGGYSPSIEELMAARKRISIPLHVMVRPDPNMFPQNNSTFCYSEMEIQWMIQYILACSVSGIDGIVIGALSPHRQVDVSTTARLLEAAGSMSVTFHRAIDQCHDLQAGVQQLIALGIPRVLSSGGAPTASEGLEKLKQLQAEFGQNIRIMPGGGIRSSNIQLILESGCSEFHSAALNTTSEKADANEIRSLKKCVN